MSDLPLNSGWIPPRLKTTASARRDCRKMVIVQQNAVLAASLKEFLHEYDYAQVVGTASDTAAAVSLLNNLNATLLITDHDEQIDGLHLCKMALQQSPSVRIVFWTDMATALTHYNRMIAAGSSGLLLRHAPVPHWFYVAPLLSFAEDAKWIDGISMFVDPLIQGLLSQDEQRLPNYKFSKAELSVLIRLRMNPAEIAAETELSLIEVEDAIASILDALGVSTVDAAVRAAEALGYSLVLSAVHLHNGRQLREISKAVKGLDDAAEFRRKRRRG